MGVNRVELEGVLFEPPTIRAVASGGTMATFALSHSAGRKLPNGQWENTRHYFDCVAFGEAASALAQWFHANPGARAVVTVSGKLNQRRWEAKDGSKRSSVEIVVYQVTIEPMRGKADSSHDTPRPDARAVSTAQSAQSGASVAGKPLPGAFDDIPF